MTVTYLYIPAGEDENGNPTAPTYLITINNPNEEAVILKAILTAEGANSGITFIITDGNTQTILESNTQANTIVIEKSPVVEEESPEEQPEENA